MADHAAPGIKIGSKLEARDDLPGCRILSCAEKLSHQDEEHEKVDDGKKSEGKVKEKQGALVAEKTLRVTDSWIQVWTFWRENVDQRQDGGEEERETESKAAEDSQF